MIHADLRKYGYHRGLHYIGRVGHTAHAALQHHQVALLFLKIKKGHGRLHFEGRGMMQTFRQHRLSCCLYTIGQSGYRFLRNIFLVHLNPFPIIKNRRGNVPPHLISGLFQNRGNIRQCRSLSVRSRDMHKLQIILGISKPPKQLPLRIQSQHISVFRRIINKSSRFLISHNLRLGFLNYVLLYFTAVVIARFLIFI